MGGNAKIVHVNITFRNTEPTDALRSYAIDKFSHALQKFVHSDTEAHVVLQVEKNFQLAEIIVRCDGNEITGKEEATDLYAAIDTLVGSLTQQLRKHKEKLTAHH